MMLALGMFVFMRQTLPHQTMQRESDYRWPSNSRIGKRDAYQFLGVGEENMTLAGVLYPELTGGKLTMTTLRLMAEEGRAWPLLDGTGMIYGMYVISRVSETGSIFFADGTPRKIDFTLSLTGAHRMWSPSAPGVQIFAGRSIPAGKAPGMTPRSVRLLRR